MSELERQGLDDSISFEEMRYMVQLVTAQSEVNAAANAIAALRKQQCLCCDCSAT